MLNTRLRSLPIKDTEINDAFWNKYISLVDKVILPYQWELMNERVEGNDKAYIVHSFMNSQCELAHDRVEGAQKSYCIHNFRVAAGLQDGEHKGAVFQDTDMAKWLEAVAYTISSAPDKELENLADQTIELIELSQCEDGYINTYYTINTDKKRWSNLFEGHELYTIGHLTEAAVAYYEATGKRKFLDVMCKCADYLCQVFGDGEEQKKGYPGHPEIELALVRLYSVTNVKKYLELAKFFVEKRGEQPIYFSVEEEHARGEFAPEFKDFDFDYCQAHIPVRHQKSAEGHAVRAVYLYSAVADIAYEYSDQELFGCCEELFDNIVNKRMYITGSIGSAAYGERFTSDYDLPNNTNYSETCAAIGLSRFANRMFQITGDGKYIDIVERVFYNTLLSGLALDGKHFFYVNPMESMPDIIHKNPTMNHIQTTRQPWFGVACCPPNIARTLASLSNYIYAQDEETIYINLFISNKTKVDLGGTSVYVKQSTKYPYGDVVKFDILSKNTEKEFTIAIRIPSFSLGRYELTLNGEPVNAEYKNGFCHIRRIWGTLDEIELKLDISPRFIYSNPRVIGNIGKIAITKGPVVYCVEECDNGKFLPAIEVDTSKGIEEIFSDNLPKGSSYLEVSGTTIDYESYSSQLYNTEKPSRRDMKVKAVPYCLWNNRGEGEMLVWIKEKVSLAE